MDPLSPPPVRRLRGDEHPTVVLPPAAARGQANGSNGSHGAAGALEPPPVAPTAGAPTLPGGTTAVERMRCDELTIAYAEKVAVNRVTLPVRQGEVLALIGPSGCGKTTLLRSLNRLTELTPSASRSGLISLDGHDIDELDVTTLRRRVSMVFQQPNPFPMSVFDNLAYAIREQGDRRPGRAELRAPVEEALRRAGLWDEVCDDLDHPALRLSGGQQQRLCIARSLAVGPEVLLLDEPCSALDPRSTATIEELILRLRREVAVVIVTHNLQQARRVADHVAFMYLGELVEYGTASQVFEAPRAQRTAEYVRGDFG